MPWHWWIAQRNIRQNLRSHPDTHVKLLSMYHHRSWLNFDFMSCGFWIFCVLVTLSTINTKCFYFHIDWHNYISKCPVVFLNWLSGNFVTKLFDINGLNYLAWIGFMLQLSRRFCNRINECTSINLSNWIITLSNLLRCFLQWELYQMMKSIIETSFVIHTV